MRVDVDIEAGYKSLSSYVDRHHCETRLSLSQRWTTQKCVYLVRLICQRWTTQKCEYLVRLICHRWTTQKCVYLVRLICPVFHCFDLVTLTILTWIFWRCTYSEVSRSRLSKVRAQTGLTERFMTATRRQRHREKDSMYRVAGGRKERQLMCFTQVTRRQSRTVVTSVTLWLRMKTGSRSTSTTFTRSTGNCFSVNYVLSSCARREPTSNTSDDISTIARRNVKLVTRPFPVSGVVTAYSCCHVWSWTKDTRPPRPLTKRTFSSLSEQPS